MKRARGRETATKPGARGASGTPGASAHRPSPAGSHERRRRSRAFLFYFSFYFFFFPLPLPTSQFGGWDFFILFCLFVCFSFSTSGNFCILFGLGKKKKREKKALTRQNPRNPSSILAALLGGDPHTGEGRRAAAHPERPRPGALQRSHGVG